MLPLIIGLLAFNLFTLANIVRPLEIILVLENLIRIQVMCYHFSWTSALSNFQKIFIPF